MPKAPIEATAKNFIRISAMVFGIAIACVVTLVVLLITISGNWHTMLDEDPAPAHSHAPEIAGNTIQSSREHQSLEHLAVGTSKVKVGDTADHAFEVLGRYEVGKAQAEGDPQDSSSLMVAHTYVVSGETYALVFSRSGGEGPYRVVNISK